MLIRLLVMLLLHCGFALLSTASVSKIGVHHLRNRPIRVPLPPQLLPFFVADSEPRRFRGFLPKLLSSAGKRFNFKHEGLITHGGQGVLLPNDSSSGSIGAMVQKEADFAILAYTLQRTSAIQFTRNFEYIRIFY